MWSRSPSSSAKSALLSCTERRARRSPAWGDRAATHHPREAWWCFSGLSPWRRRSSTSAWRRSRSSRFSGMGPLGRACCIFRSLRTRRARRGSSSRRARGGARVPSRVRGGVPVRSVEASWAVPPAGPLAAASKAVCLACRGAAPPDRAGRGPLTSILPRACARAHGRTCDARQRVRTPQVQNPLPCQHCRRLIFGRLRRSVK